MIGSGTGSTGGGGLSSISSTTATNQSTTLDAVDYPSILQDGGVDILGIGETTPSQSFTVGGGLRNIVVVFPAGYHIAAALTFTGKGRRNAVVTETFTCPGAGGGTVIGTVLFASVDTNGVVNESPGGDGSHIAQMQLGRKIGLATAPVAAIHKVTKSGDAQAIVASDLTVGWVDVGVPSISDFYAIHYTYSLSVTQSAHTHEAS